MASPILFYDGKCGFCNRSVQFILDHERNQEILFCSLQSSKAEEYLNRLSKDALQLNTMLLLKEGRLFQKSEAVLTVTTYLKPPWSLFRFFRFFPKKIRDAVYDLIAKRRRRLLKDYTCRIPEEKVRKRFLS